MEDLVAEDLKKPVKPPFFVLAFLPDELFTQIVAQQFAARGEFQRQLLRATDAFRRRREESGDQLCDCFGPLRHDPKRASFKIGLISENLAALHPLAVDPDPL
ncbi:MAG: hypothetical protein WBE49_08325 [Methylovirgula sp.]